MSKPYTIYNREIPAGVHPVFALLKFMRYYGHIGYRKEDGLPEKYVIFKDLCGMLWDGKSGREFLEFNPFAERISHAMLDFDKVGLAGAGSTSKSHMMAARAITYLGENFEKTLCLIVSSSLREAKKRVWGSVERLFMSIPQGFFPCRYRSSPETGIVTQIGNRSLSQAGCYLIPMDKGMKQEQTSKLVGMKNERILLILDDCGSLNEDTLNSALSNLSTCPSLKIITAYNPDSRFDFFGNFITPATENWSELSVDVESYPLKNGGICVHLDHQKNENFLQGKTIWRGIASYESIAKAVKEMPPNSYDFLRFWRGWFSDISSEKLIITEGDIIKYEGTKKATWASDFVKVFGLDAAWTNEGDKTILYVGKYGKDISGKNTIEFDRHYAVYEDATNLKVPRTNQIAQKVLQIIKEEGGEIKNLAVDSTSGGSVFCDAIAMEAGSNDFYRVNFGGAASDDRTVSEFDSTIASEFYANRVTEIWFSFLYYLRAGQIKGMDTDLVKEITLRRYDSQGRRKIAESKKDMKIRINKSPDLSDSACILVALCREKLGATPLKQIKSASKQWRNFSKKYDVVSQSENAEFADGSESFYNSLTNLN